MMLWELMDFCKRFPYNWVEEGPLKQGMHLREQQRPKVEARWEAECPGVGQLMQDCWKEHPHERPHMCEVVSRLLKIIAAS
jgi:hypothetical protein